MRRFAVVEQLNQAQGDELDADDLAEHAYEFILHELVCDVRSTELFALFRKAESVFECRHRMPDRFPRDGIARRRQHLARGSVSAMAPIDCMRAIERLRETSF